MHCTLSLLCGCKKAAIHIGGVLLTLLPVTAAAETIGYDQAAQIAAEFLGCQSVTLEHLEGTTAAPLIYIFNAADGAGSVYVAGDDRAVRPVLGFSRKSNVLWDEANDAFRDIISGMAKGMLKLRQAPENEIRRRVARSRAAVSGFDDAVEPLLGCWWKQGSPYNDMCPTIDGKHCVTGCVATAISMVLYHHKWPKHGAGKVSYIWNGTTLEADLSQSVYAYDKMQPTYYGDVPQENRDAVALLMHDVGYAMHMVYGLTESSSNPSASAMFDNFDYDHDMQEMDYGSSNQQEFIDILRNEFKQGRPVIAENFDPVMGHVYVIDGYNSDGYFHFNLGWGEENEQYLLIDGTGWTGPLVFFNIKPDEGGTGAITPQTSGETRWTGTGDEISHGCFTYLLCDITFEYTLAFENTATGSVQYQQGGEVTGSWYVPSPLTVTAKLADGEYKVYPVIRKKGDSKWLRFPQLDDQQNEVPMTVSGGKRTYHNNDIKIDGLFYKIDSENHTAAIIASPYDEPPYSNCPEVVEVPDNIEYNGQTYPVTAISRAAFDHRPVKELHLGHNVTNIELCAFIGTTLKSVTFADPSKLYEISYGAFESTPIDSIALPEGVTVCGDDVFRGSSLRILKLPSTLDKSYLKVYSEFLEGCSHLERLYVKWDFPPTGTFVNFMTIKMEHPERLRIIVPQGCRQAYEFAKYWRDYVILEEGEVDDGRESTTDFDPIDDGVTKVGEDYYILDDKELTAIYTRRNANSCQTGNIVVPDEITYDGKTYRVVAIASNAISGANPLSIGRYVKRIEEYGAQSCRNVTFAKGSELEYIGSRGLAGIRQDCLVLPDGVKTIASQAFNYSSVTCVHLPASITYLGSDLFWDNGELKDVFIESKEPLSSDFLASSGKDSPNGSDVETTYVHIPSGSLDAYQANGSWSKYVLVDDADEPYNSIQIGTTTVIDSLHYTVHEHGKVTVSLIEGYTIDENGYLVPNFYKGYNPEGRLDILSTVDFNGCEMPVTRVPQYGFLESNLSAINLPSTLTNIGFRAFRHCDKLSDIYCYAATPPELNSSAFDTYTATLHVPADCKKAYRQAEYWKNFNIVADLPADINAITTDNKDGETQYFDLLGRRINTLHGHNIIIERNGDKLKKVIR